MESQQSLLFLHFDLNKTLIFVDPAGGKNLEDMLNSIVAEVTWGRKIPDPSSPYGYQWVPDHSLPTSSLCPQEGTINYHEFVEDILAYPPVDPEENPTVRKDKIKLLKDKRKKCNETFTKEGQPGHIFKPIFDKLKASLIYEHNGEKKLIFILPSFFNLILYLVEKKRNFVIIFRSFGHDLETVAEAFNEFCEGKHPLYPTVQLTGEHGYRDLRLKKEKISENSGVMFRCNGGSEDSAHLIVGTQETVPDHEEGLLFYKKNYPDVKIISGFRNIYLYLKDASIRCIKEGGSLSIRDYYTWWSVHNESPEAGKCHLVDEDDKSIHPIFFDDNFWPSSERKKQSILDCRNFNSGKQLTDPQNIFAVQVLPYRAVLEPNYFIEQLEICEKNRK